MHPEGVAARGPKQGNRLDKQGKYVASLPRLRSLVPSFLSQLQFSTGELATIQRLGQARGRQDLFTKQAPEQLKSLRQVALIESSESSNRIEGITVEEGRVEALVQRGSAPRDRSEQEIAGYRDALELIHEQASDIPFSANVVLQLHTMIYRYLPEDGGRWKPADNEIVERDTAGQVVRVRFKAVPAVATPGAMRDLEASYREAVQGSGRAPLEPLVAVPLAVLDFLCIHPFRDGNGRVARLLTLLLLYHFDYQVGRYVSLERIIEESKETYYEALEASSRGWHEGQHDVHPWLNYLWGVLIRAYGEFEERMEAAIKSGGNKTAQIRAAVERRTAPFAISDLESELPSISRDMVRHVLRLLRTEGMVEVVGQGRGAKWRRK